MIHIQVCTCTWGVHVCVSVLGSVLSVYLYLFVCLVACCSISGPFGEIQIVAGDPDPIRICARCGPDIMVIQRPIGMIRRPIPVRAVKTRRRFGSETASFHVSVLYFLIECFSIISYECSLFIY